MEGDERMDDKQRFDTGMNIRREVLGAEYVDSGMAAADDFSMAMQDLTTRYCWGDIWARPGLDRKYRSMVIIGALVGADIQPGWASLMIVLLFIGAAVCLPLFNAAHRLRHGLFDLSLGQDTRNKWLMYGLAALLSLLALALVAVGWLR